MHSYMCRRVTIPDGFKFSIFLYHSITWVSSSTFKRTPQLWITICIPRFKWACRLTRLCQHAPNRHVSLCPDLGTQQHGPHACVQHWVHVDEFITINTDYFCEDDSILYLPAHIQDEPLIDYSTNTVRLGLATDTLHSVIIFWTGDNQGSMCPELWRYRVIKPPLQFRY